MLYFTLVFLFSFLLIVILLVKGKRPRCSDGWFVYIGFDIALRRGGGLLILFQWMVRITGSLADRHESHIARDCVIKDLH